MAFERMRRLAGSEGVNDLVGSAFASGNRAFHEPAEFGGGLGARPVNGTDWFA
jgi:hypothetical protein